MLPKYTKARITKMMIRADIVKTKELLLQFYTYRIYTILQQEPSGFVK